MPSSALILAVCLISALYPALPALAFTVASDEPARSRDTLVQESPSQEKKEYYPDLETLYALYQPYVFNISAYEPIYFLVGTDPQKSKIQISFKYRFFNPQGPLTTSYPWMRGFHFGYTQTSLWDLRSASAPFEDNSYKPELFFVSPNITPSSRIDGLFFQTGFQHESNGRDGDSSRTTNFLYIRPIAIFYKPESQSGLLVSVKIWTYVKNSERRNPDLKDYRGYFELESKFGKADGWVVGSVLRWADQGPSVNVDLTYPLHRILNDNLDFYFQVNYANVLAEGLLDYRQRTKALRLGIAIVR